MPQFFFSCFVAVVVTLRLDSSLQVDEYSDYELSLFFSSYNSNDNYNYLYTSFG